MSEPPANPLFSSSNFDFTSNPLFMPLTDQNAPVVLSGWFLVVTNKFVMFVIWPSVYLLLHTK